MTYAWTSEDIEKILIQLNNQMLPFKKYCFTELGHGMKLLGTGGYAAVYEAQTRYKEKNKYAIKVIGFGDKHINSSEFRKSVDAQKDLSTLQSNVVKVYNSVELRVWIDDYDKVTKVIKISEDNNKQPEENYLDIQFIVMERINPILIADKPGKPRLFPEALANYDEKEILKLAYEIGTALHRAQEKKLLHRDVKLENILYDPKGKHYKLGDFGIAKMTDDGMASTVAFTKGYGAPEVVGSLDEKYDNTADIYSFGMLLYILLNALKFPNSENYNVNVSEQYSQGYVLPYPDHGSEELCQIIGKMCAFDPDERYQNMNDVLNELQAIMIDKSIRYKREHIQAPLVIGMIFLFLGMVAWKLTFNPTLEINLNKWMYIFLILSIFKGILNFVKKDITFVSLIILGIGTYLLISSGFEWWKLLLLLCISFSTGTLSFGIGGIVLLLNVTYLVTSIKSQHIMMGGLVEYKWAAVTLIFLAAMMLVEYITLSDINQEFRKMYYKKNRYWLVLALFFMSQLICGLTLEYGNTILFEKLWGRNLVDMLRTWNLIKVGIIGFVFSIFWVVRERILINIENRSRGY